METLPDEILLWIFSYVNTPKTVLVSIPSVCRKWKSLCSSSFTGMLDFSFKDEDYEIGINDQNILQLRKRFKYIWKVNLKDETLKNSTLIEICRCNKLTSINLSQTYIDSLEIKKIIENNINLSHLNLKSCVYIKECFLEKKCNLTHLNFANNCLKDEILVNIASFCPKLVKLDISFSVINNKGLLELLDKCVKLSHLKITGCYKIDLDKKYFSKMKSLYCLGTKIIFS